MKKYLILLFVLAYTTLPLQVFAESTLRGGIQEEDTIQTENSHLFTGQVDYLERKDTIHMTVSQVLDGNYSLEGDEFFAQVTSDVSGDNGVILPKGTVAHGFIKEAAEAKRLGRDGYLELSFDYLITPDGREIPIEGKMSTKLHPIKAATKIVAQDIGYTAVGGVVGGMVATQMLGLEAAIASQGYTVAGGVAVGGAVGLGMALYRKGKDVLISPGDEIKVKISTDVALPVYKEEALKKEEITCENIKIRIANIVYEKDPFGEANTLTLSLSISNMSEHTFSGMDMTLVNDYNVSFNPSVFGDTRLLFSQIKPGDRFAGKISFAVNNVKDSHWLCIYDKKSKDTLVKISLDNAYKNVSEDIKKKNNKVKRAKKNFYKEENYLEI